MEPEQDHDGAVDAVDAVDAAVDAVDDVVDDAAVPDPPWSGARRGPLRVGEWITLTDGKGRRHSIRLTDGKQFHTSRGAIDHDDLIGGPDGVTVTTQKGVDFLALRPLMPDHTLAMPRGAAVIYPKDAAQILIETDVFPGATVLEAGAGSGALSVALLRAVGEHGRVISYERRDEFADVCERNVEVFFGGRPPTWELVRGDLATAGTDDGAPGLPPVDRAILDMLAPWECVDVVAAALRPGGVLCGYLATTTQLSRYVETLRVHGGFTEPRAWETMVREWHVEGLAVRPGHRMQGHTAFLVTARRLAPGHTPPRRTRRPAPGAYGSDYTGPRPTGT